MIDSSTPTTVSAMFTRTWEAHCRVRAVATARREAIVERNHGPFGNIAELGQGRRVSLLIDPGRELVRLLPDRGQLAVRPVVDVKFGGRAGFLVGDHDHRVVADLLGQRRDRGDRGLVRGPPLRVLELDLGAQLAEAQVQLLGLRQRGLAGAGRRRWPRRSRAGR